MFCDFRKDSPLEALELTDDAFSNRLHIRLRTASGMVFRRCVTLSVTFTRDCEPHTVAGA